MLRIAFSRGTSRIRPAFLSAGEFRFKSSKVMEEDPAPFVKLMAANRGEIATRINRAASELGVLSAGIYSYEGELRCIEVSCRKY
jgi:hypothetical protein